MCYAIYLSTTDCEDLSKSSCEHFKVQALEPNSEACRSLTHPYRRALLSRFGGCSCHFRHVANERPDFGPVEGWSPEDADDVEATAAAYELLRQILARNHKLEVLDLWNDASEAIRFAEVRLSEVPRDHFGSSKTPGCR